TATGSLSVDGGATTTPINFSANQVVADAASGAVTNVNSTAIRRAGDVHLEYAGTADAFQTLIALRDELRNTRGLSDHDQALALAGRIGDVQRVHDSILQTVGVQAADLQNLDGLEGRLQDVQLETRKLVSDTESVDIADVVVKLQEQTN